MKLRVVHYLNQFFGQIGGEDQAGVGPQVKEGPVGPGRAAQEALKGRGEVVATAICGDNYFAENVEQATREVEGIPFKEEFAGPVRDFPRYAVNLMLAEADRSIRPVVEATEKEKAVEST